MSPLNYLLCFVAQSVAESWIYFQISTSHVFVSPRQVTHAPIVDFYNLWHWYLQLHRINSYISHHYYFNKLFDMNGAIKSNLARHVIIICIIALIYRPTWSSSQLWCLLCPQLDREIPRKIWRWVAVGVGKGTDRIGSCKTKIDVH